MVSYIEYLILDNLLMDALLCCLTLYALSRRVVVWRVLLAALTGTAAAVLLPLVNLPAAVLFFIKLASGCVLPPVFTRLKSFKEYLRVLLMFFMFTFVLGGASFAAVFLIEKDFTKAANLLYGGLPIGAILGGIGFAALSLIQLALYLNKHRCQMKFRYEAVITVCGKSVRVHGFLDSGNRLYDPLTNFPVAIVNLSVLYKILGEGFLPALLFKKSGAAAEDGGAAGKLKARYIPYSAMAGGGGRLMVIAPDKIEIYSGKKQNTIYDVMLGVSYKKLDDGSCEVLLHPALISEAI